MKRSTSYISTSAVLLAAALLAASCTKTVVEEGNGDTNAHEISLSVSEGAMTRALVDNSNFGTDGNRIQVYDFWTNESTTSKYIDALAGPEVVSNSAQHVKGTTWPFVDKESGDLVRYNWTSTGTHKFFGWYAVDATTKVPDADDATKKVNMTAESFFGSDFGFNETTKVLSIPETTLDGNTPQFDFLYSDIKSVNVEASIPANVSLSFSHLFAAVSFGAENTTSSEIKLLEFKVEKLHNQKSATISFSGSTPSVVYSDGSEGGVVRSVVNAGGEIVPKKGSGTMNNIFGEAGDPQDFMLMWPQSISQLHSGEVVTEDPDTGDLNYPDSYKMYVKYSVDGIEFTKRLNFDDKISWEAGNKYHYNIIFADKMVELKCIVNPWEYVDQDIDFKENIAMKDGGQISWNTEKSNVEYPYVYIKDGQAAEGTFTFDTPEGGRWIAALEGDVDAFTLIDGEGAINGTAATVKVAPAISNPVRDYKVELRFIVRKSDGTTLDADDFVQPDGKKYTIVLQKN